MGCVGYYVHHHGAGHLSRFRAIAAVSSVELVPVSELAIDGGLRLPTDVPSGEVPDPSAGGSLHWAPLDSSTATVRLKTFVDWLDAARPDAMVIDVSVEAALVCRLAGIPTAIVRQHGNRLDPAHRLAYASASQLIAPFPRELDSSTDRDVVARTDHVGFITPRAVSPSAPLADGRPVDVGPSDAVVIWGTGGGHLRGRDLDALAASIQGIVYCAGRDIWRDTDPPSASNIVDLGWVASPGSLLGARPLTVASVGNNCVALVAAHRCPFVAVPQARPFGEQELLAERLAGSELAAVAPDRPEARAWAEAVDAARRRSTGWDDLAIDDGGARRAAAVIERMVQR